MQDNELLSKTEKERAFKKIRNAKIPKEGEFEHFTPSLDGGLSYEQVTTRFNQFLFNDNKTQYSRSYFSIIAGNLFTFFNLLAAVVAVILILASAPITQFAFALIFLINIIVGIVLEIMAKNRIDKLNLVTSPVAKVVRAGEKQEIPANEIVVDDILILESGQQIPVDCVMLDGSAEANESMLTGESVPVKKQDGDTLYAGSFMVSGTCYARAQTVGQATYINQLTAKAKKYKRPHSEIRDTINLFICVIAPLMLIIAGLNVFLNWPDSWSFATFQDLATSTSAVIIGMIPSGMLLLCSIAMSMGIIRLSKNHTLVNDMYSLEMLARVDVLCLDKTGTITDGNMKVKDLIPIRSYSKRTSEEIIGSYLLAIGDNNQTSQALFNEFGHNALLQPKTVVPFSSKRKLSAVTFEGEGTYVLGAPEFVLKPMPTKIAEMVKSYAEQGLRVLALAHSSSAIRGENIPTTLRPVALITLQDNIRPDAKETIAWFKENDVAVKIISGDNPVTVSQVALRAGVDNAENYISLEGLTDEEVAAAADKYTVFGRVTPEQKAILVTALKGLKHTVAMTGDGVNDILAMKEADCAVSMAAGSEAARNVSNLVLQDNNFSNMPKVVYEGRQVINNVKHSSSLYIMKTLFTAMLAIICIALGRQYLFDTSNMLLFESMVAGLPSVILALQPNTERVKGRYFTYVLCHAIPAAMTMIFSVMAIYAGSMLQFNAFTFEYQALAVVAVTLTGMVMLFHQCRPFNLLRIITYAVSVVVCALFLAIPFLTEIIFTGWSTVQFSLTGVLLLICVIQFALPLSTILLKFFGWLEKKFDR